MISFLQVNVGVGRAAQDLAIATATKLNSDFLLLSEQNRSGTEIDGWFPDSQNRSAIVVRGQIPINQFGPHESGFRWTEAPGLRVYSCYWSPNCSIAEFEYFILRLERSIRTSALPCVVAGDFNAKSRLWGSPTEDKRGVILADMMSALDLYACNSGDTPTFVRGQSESHIDVTFVSNTIRGRVEDWKVLDIESLSLHKYISFTLKSTLPRRLAIDRMPPGWSTRSLKPELMKASLALTHLPPHDQLQSAELEASNLVTWITKAADKCLKKTRTFTGKQPVHWWSREIGLIRGECNKARRIHQRTRKRLGEDGSRASLERWKELRRSLATAIKSAKERCWSHLIATVDSDVWGKPYKIIMRKLRRPRPIPGIELPGRLGAIVNGLFPAAPPRGNVRLPQTSTGHEPLCSAADVASAAGSLPNNKAPGPDGISNEMIKVAVNASPESFAHAYNRCFAEGCFPTNWKIGRLVLIPKPGKPLDNPTAYRPICLLDGCGKLLEKLVVAKLREHLVGEHEISDNQYGFRRGRSTIDALERLKSHVQAATSGHYIHHKLVGMLTLDVRNAFNSAPWEAIVEAARSRSLPPGLLKILEDYLSNRAILASTPSDRTSFVHNMSCGVPQGSVLGPDLWNLLYDGLLRTRMPEGVNLLAFADDVAVLATHKVHFELEEKLEEAYRSIERWMTEHGLQLAAEKTEAIVLTNKRVRNEISVRCGGFTIESKPSIKYLGVQVDKKLKFTKHAELAADRAAEAAKHLGYLMPNMGGPREKSRRLLTSVTTSRLLYAAPFWSDTMSVKGWKKLAAIHRRSQLRVACCYRTVSYEAAAVISGIPPISLLAKERTEIYKGRDKAEARRDLIAKWQEEWDNGTNGNGRWTHRLIGRLEEWLSRKSGQVTYHLTQVLSGHGCFGSYLHRFHLLDSDACAQCGHSPDDPEHAIFKCDAWENWRLQTCGELEVEELRADNLIQLMTSTPEKWKLIAKLVSRIMVTREREERRRQHQPR